MPDTPNSKQLSQHFYLKMAFSNEEMSSLPPQVSKQLETDAQYHVVAGTLKLGSEDLTSSVP